MSVALLFSPQGSQAVGMGRTLALASPAARAVYDEADATLGWSLSELCFEGPADRLNDTRQTQPCLVATSVASLRALEEALASAGATEPIAFVAGHSVGEYAALVAAGVLDLPDALRLAGRRGQLMGDVAAGGMTAVIGLDRKAVADVVAGVGLGPELVVANDNAPGQVVISGSHEALAAAEGPLRAAGARRQIPLAVSGAFHSPAMEPVGAELSDAFGSVTWRDAHIPMVSNVTAEPVSASAEIQALLARQVSSPVEWVRSVRRMLADGVDTFVECGPGSALVGMLRRIAPAAEALAVSDPASVEAAAARIARVPSGAPG